MIRSSDRTRAALPQVFLWILSGLGAALLLLAIARFWIPLSCFDCLGSGTEGFAILIPAICTSCEGEGTLSLARYVSLLVTGR